MAKTIDVEKYKEMYLTFANNRKNLMLNMLDDEGKPFISCAPFVKKDGKLYIYISQVAEHYRFIENSDTISAFIVADESETKNTFATERARWSCSVKKIADEGNEDIFQLYDENFDPKLMAVLKGLDFSLFELTPMAGRYVVGFGLAFDVDIDGNVFNHVVVDKKDK